MFAFVRTFLLIFSGLALGYIIQQLSKTGKIRTSENLIRERKALQKAAILVLNPVAFLGAIWIIEWPDLRLLALPLLGVTAILLGGVFAFLFARMQRFSRPQTGSYIVSGAFTNMGSLGGLLVYSFLGEAAFALVPFYKLLEEFCYYGIGFPIARAFSSGVKEKGKKTGLLAALSDPFFFVSLGAMLIGLILNLTGVPRPAFYTPLNAFLIPFASFVLILSIGMAMRFGSVRQYRIPALLTALIKFVLLPVSVTALAILIGFPSIGDGVPFKVILILSAMPSGFLSLVVPTLYELDLELSNASWLMTNGLLFAVSPLLFLIIQAI